MTTVEKSRTALRRRELLATVLAMVIAAIGPAGAAKAQAAGDLVDLQVFDRESGQPLRVWPHDRRLFVAGQPGSRYSLRVTNRSDGRVLVVMSVDGVNIVSGETAAYGQTGYVLYPYQSYDVTGWRKSDSEVAAFVFAALSQSYAARTGRPGDVGVIGIAAFGERAAPPIPVAPVYSPRSESPRPESRNSAGSALDEIVVTGERRAAPSQPAMRSPQVIAEEPRAEKLGTAHGAREWSVITNVAFERATSYPQLVRRIEYDSHTNLIASGVIPRPWDGGRRPRPFPSNGDGAGYVPDPPGGR